MIALKKIVRGEQCLLEEMPSEEADLKKCLLVASHSNHFYCIEKWMTSPRVVEVFEEFSTHHFDQVMKMSSLARAWVLINTRLSEENEKILGFSVVSEKALSIDMIYLLLDWSRGKCLPTTTENPLKKSLELGLSLRISELLHDMFKDYRIEEVKSASDVHEIVVFELNNSMVFKRLNELFLKHHESMFSMLKTVKEDQCEVISPEAFMEKPPSSRSNFRLRQVLVCAACDRCGVLFKHQFLEHQMKHVSSEVVKKKTKKWRL